MTFEDLKRVNETVKRIEVKGKAYACVPARVQAFRELYPNGLIETEIVAMGDGVVTMRTSIFDEDGKKLSTGFAQEKESKSGVNSTSYIENCETSAVGRALGMLGIGSDEQMASAEEMVNAIGGQEGPKASREEMISFLQEYYADDAKKKAALNWAVNNLYSEEDRKAMKRELTEFTYMKHYALEKFYIEVKKKSGSASET